MDMETQTEMESHSMTGPASPPAPQAQAEQQSTLNPMNKDGMDGTEETSANRAQPETPEIATVTTAPTGQPGVFAASADDADAGTVATVTAPGRADTPTAQDDQSASGDDPKLEAHGTDLPPVVPLARLQGVQRQLSQVQKDLMAARVEATVLRETLSAAEKRAAGEYAERLRVTERHIVPQLIGGETIEQVDQSLANSKAAFSAAQQAYARLLPTPANARVGAAAPPDADQGLTPLQLLRAGLSQTKDDINR